MPQTRPAEISDGVSLSDKLAPLVCAFVSKYRTVDALLPGIIFEFSPHEKSVTCEGSEDDFFSGAAEQFWTTPVFIDTSGIVPVI
jgi:hypothetical protein